MPHNAAAKSYFPFSARGSSYAEALVFGVRRRNLPFQCVYANHGLGMVGESSNNANIKVQESDDQASWTDVALTEKTDLVPRAQHAVSFTPTKAYIRIVAYGNTRCSIQFNGASEGDLIKLSERG